MDNYSDPFKISQLILKSLRGELSPQEEEEFKNWLKRDDKNLKLFNSFKKEKDLDKELTFFSGINTQKAWHNIAEKVNAGPVINPWWQRSEILKYAAAILLVAFSTLVMYKELKLEKDPVRIAAATPASIVNDVEPGGDKAKLILSDGTEILLETLADGVVREENGTRITQKGGQVTYKIISGKKSNSITLNTISTPKGGQYRIILPDGSQVWLNAASSLQFPTAFLGKERRVLLRGEGYFEVAKNKNQPFRVQTAHTTTEVLGTHFNISAYPEEEITRTTLLEGSVKVTKGPVSRLINPGQQAIMGEAGISLATVDPEEVVAWKEGLFQFNNADLKSITGQLERWYDVDFVFEGEMPGGHYSGIISRNNNVSQVLHMLELSGSIKFRIEERRIMVLSKK